MFIPQDKRKDLGHVRTHTLLSKEQKAGLNVGQDHSGVAER